MAARVGSGPAEVFLECRRITRTYPRLVQRRRRSSRQATRCCRGRSDILLGLSYISSTMEDLTTGPLTRHLLKTTSFMLVTMIFQTLYFLIDLYWVGRLGTHAVAAVGIAGNFTFIVLALTQMLGVGTTTAVSHAVGRKNHEEAQLMFNQAQALAVVTGIAFLIVGMLERFPYTRAMSADVETAALAAPSPLLFIPAMALPFLMVAGAGALGAG